MERLSREHLWLLSLVLILCHCGFGIWQYFLMKPRSFCRLSGKSWIQTTFYKRECVKFLPATRDHHRCSPVCHVCQNLVRCCCGRLIGEHSELDSNSWLYPSGDEEVWCVVQHTKTSPTDAFGSINFQGGNKCSCRAKYVRLSCDAKPEELRCLMLREWNMAQPKLLISVHGGTDNFTLPQRLGQAFSKGLIRAAESAGAWIFTDGFNTGVSMYVGDAVKAYGTHERRKRTVIGITPWGLIENHTDLIGRDVLRHYQTLGNPLSKRSSLNGLHSHFLLVDDGTLGKSGCQQELRRKLERHIHRQRIHPRLSQRVPLVCVVVEGGPAVLSTVLEYVSRSPPVPVIVFEGTGRAADLLSLIHKQTAADRELDVNIKGDFLQRIENVFGVARTKALQLFTLLKHCMEHREAITIFDSESEDHLEADVAILTASLRGTPAEKLSVTLAWDRADIAQQHVLVYGHHWQVGDLEQAMLNALLMNRVSFVKLLIENGVTMKHFLTVSRLEELYNMQHQGSSDHFLRHIIEDAKQCRLPARYKISLMDIGMVIEYLIGGAYRSTYRSKSFKAVYNRIHSELKEGCQERSASERTDTEPGETQQQFYRTAHPYRRKIKSESLPNMVETVEVVGAERGGSSLFIYSFNDLFVWAVLKRRQQLALFLWQHGMQAMARAVVACRLYQAMASEAKESNMSDSITDELKKYSLEFGQLAVDLLDKAFKENERMAMKLLTWEMTDWSNFTCLQMAVASGHRPFVAHSCTQMLLTDLWMGRLNMRKNSWLKIIVSILLPVGIQLLEFKSEAEMSHVPQSQEALQFVRDPANLGETETEDAVQADESDAERGRSRLRHRPGWLAAWWLPCSRKVYDFYSAPVVKFWVHTMSYLTFLALFSYTVLVRMGPKPSVPEWLVFAYITSTAVDKIREVLVSEPRRLRKKLKMWFSEYWNINDFVAIILFFTGMALRWYTGLIHITGRIIYCLDIIFWFVRLLDLLAINQQAGPYLTMIANMMKNMFYIVVIMGIVLVSFGTPRWSILHPYEEPSWNLLKQVLFQPYFMMFGEVYATEINPCEEDPDCPPGSFLNPLLQAVYLFMQYIIMVNLLIAFYNNVYIHMKTISNQLWRYNRYRYIMTYHKKPLMPPPLIILSHVALCVSTVWQKHRRTSMHDRGSVLKLFLAPDDLKKLLEFEESCVSGYFRDKHESQHCSQVNRIRLAADKTEEMMGTLAEVSEKVQFIQGSLQTLDAHLGQLQDLSALAVDTLNLLSASENRQQEAVHLCPSPRITVASCSPLSSFGGTITPSHIPTSPKAYYSNPPSIPRGLAHGKSCSSLEPQPGGSGSSFDSKLKWVLGNLEAEHSIPRQRLGGDSSLGLRLSHGSLSNLWSDLHGSPGQSCASSLTTVWDHEPHHLPSQEESMEEEEDDDVFIDTRVKRNSVSGIVNPAFCGDSELATPRHGHFGRKWPFAIERELEHSRSLSASVETLAATTKRHSVSGEPILLHPGQKDRDLHRIVERKRSFGRKCVKIKEGEASDVRRLERDLSRRSRRKGKGTAGHKFRTSVSLSQLSFDHVDFLQKSVTLGQNTRSPSQSVWNSWARSVSRRSSVQSWAAVEPRTSVFKSTEDLDPHYSAMERNNLMRLAHTIPFTPVSLLGGEEVYVYTLEEPEPDSVLSGASLWCQRGHAAVLQPVSEQGVLDGGLRRAQWVLCTWAEKDVLRPGCVYVVKSFREEVVHKWQTEFNNNATLHLCLREIQQHRAAHKLMQVFNQVKPSSIPHSPRFLDVSLLCWQTKGQWLTIERSMNGDFMKYNSSTGDEITPSCGLEETVLAFSHWTYEYTRRELLVLDLQGVGADLTEPSVIRAGDKSPSRDLVFGIASLGADAVRSFVLKHTCNSCCEKLGLTDLRKSSNLLKPASEEYVSTG